MTVMLCAVMMFTFIFSMNVEAKSKKGKKVAIVAGIGLAGAIAAICLLPGSTTNSTRSQTSNLRAISSFAAAQPTAAAAPAAAVRPEPIASITAQPNAQIESYSTVDLRCVRDERQKNAFRVIALREHLKMSVLTCQRHDPRYNNIVANFQSQLPRLQAQFNESHRDLAKHFQNNKTLEDAYFSNLLAEQSWIISRRSGQGNQQFCNNQLSLIAQVAALPNGQALVQFAAANPQPMVSPCSRSR